MASHVGRMGAPTVGARGGMMDVHDPWGAAGWRINGHPARLLIWSAEEWERLDVRPIDAQYHPFGVWCALRLVE
ncbi:hypothetical protein [Paludisphaera sp.]|uniref:hypothetical protein n=1 Tax=Paludisphaera sp. TaxID=2017432 RepID=UPI00301CD3E8